MADEKETKGATPPAETEAVLAGAPKGGQSMPFLLLCAGIVVLAAGAGYGTAVLLGGAKPADAGAATPAEPAPPPPAKTGPAEAKEEFAYYDFEAIVVNLDEPRLARYVRVTITLAIRPENRDVAVSLLDKRKPELKNWLTVYFSSCTLEGVRGAANLNRLRREILDAFSQQLWPNQKPLINHVLFKEFAIS